MSLLAWYHAVVGFEAEGPAPVDQPGTLDPGVTISGRNRVFASVLSDPDGIRSVGRATVTARSDGQVAEITFTRRDANTFVHAIPRRNSRWNSGTMSVAYIDGLGNSITLVADWTVT
ncbi:MAG: hypothetical protein OXB91_07465 [Bryobacterales bacterium]|nr:hypothetical protein [Bryobacterales bacterium]